MGKMTTSYGRTPADVRVWPVDPVARQALKEYLVSLSPDLDVVDDQLNGRGMDFTGADLSGLDLSAAEFNDATLIGVRMVGAELSYAWLMGAKLRGADLTGGRLRKVEGRGCDARDAILRETDWERSDFDSADFRGADLRGALFRRAFIPDADLRGADLRDCVFGTSVGSTGLFRARLAGCLLTGAHGPVDGPIDIGADAPHLIDGGELQEWFASQGAPLIEVETPRR